MPGKRFSEIRTRSNVGAFTNPSRGKEVGVGGEDISESASVKRSLHVFILLPCARARTSGAPVQARPSFVPEGGPQQAGPCALFSGSPGVPYRGDPKHLFAVFSDMEVPRERVALTCPALAGSVEP